MADGTGRSDVEVRWLLVTAAGSIVVGGAVAIGFGVLRLIDFRASA